MNQRRCTVKRGLSRSRIKSRVVHQLHLVIPHFYLHMASDVRIDKNDVRVHGDIIEFLNDKRCVACQSSTSRKCLIQESDEKCVSCSGADQKCVFRRPIVALGSPRSFKWNGLLELKAPTLAEFTSNQSVRTTLKTRMSTKYI